MSVLRSYNIGNILQGQVDVYSGIEAITSTYLNPSADTQLLVFTGPKGEPVSLTGTHLGSVDGPTNVTITEKLNEIMDDQHETAIDVALDSVTAEVDFILKETNLRRLATLSSSDAMTYANLSGAGKKVINVGGKFNAQMYPVTLTLVSPDRSHPTKQIYIHVHMAVLKSAIQITFSRSKEATYKLKFDCIADVTRVMGDELMHIARTK